MKHLVLTPSLAAQVGAGTSPVSRLVRRGPSPMALEQRFMFDGAALADAAHALTDSAVLKTLVDKNVGSEPAALVSAEAEAQRLVTAFLSQPDARAQLFALFNGGQTSMSPAWQAAYDQLMASLGSGEGAIRVELRSASEMQGAKGAFTRSGVDGQATIYLNADWLSGNPSAGIGPADSASITAVLVEELGHSLDARLNGSADTPGDEGQHFSHVLVDGANAYASDAGSSNQDDSGVLQLDGQTVNVEFASYAFVNAYEMVYDLNHNGVVEGNIGESLAAKEQSVINFNPNSPLGQVTVNDGTGSQQFSGNDVSATSLVLGGNTYYGWISRPIKSGGIVRGFYFWTDARFTSLALAQVDGNADTNGAADNRGFVLVVDQSWFDGQIASTRSTTINGSSIATGTTDTNGLAIPTSYATVGSSSDRVDAALNALLPSNVAPVAVADAGDATEAGGLANAVASVDASGNVLSNDTDANTVAGSNYIAGETKTVTQVGLSSANQSVAAASTSGSNATTVTGTYGTLSMGADGSYSYHITDNSSAAMQALRTSSNTLTETFTYTVVDKAGLTSTTTLTVTIHGSNDTPVAVDDYGSAKVSLLANSNTSQYTSSDPQGSLATGNVLTNDTDVDRNGETKAIVGMTTSGSATGSTSGAGTSVTVLSFVTLPGSVAAGSYVFLDGDGQVNNNSGTLTALTNSSGTQLTVGSINTANKTMTLSGLVNNVSLTGTSVLGFSNKANGSANYKDSSMSSATGVSTTNVTLSGAVTGTVAVGMTESSTGATVTAVTYNSSGVATALTLNQGSLSFTGRALSFSGTSVSGSTLTGQYGVLALNADGSYTYTPTANNPAIPAGQSAVDNFSYSMVDAAGATSAAILHITVQGSSAADPNANADTNTATEAGGAANATAGVDPAGNVISGAISLPVSGSGGAADTSPSGPNYVIAARAGSSSADTTVTTVTTTGTIASGSKNVVTVSSAAGISVGMGVAGTGVPSGTTVSAISGTTVTLSASASASTSGTGFLFVAPTSSMVLHGQYGDLTLRADGSYTYAVNNSDATVQALHSATDTLTDVFNYTISNGQLSGGTSGSLLKDSTTLTITVKGANDAPVAVNESATATEASGFNSATAGYNPGGNVLSNDTDVDDASSALRVTGVRTGSTEGAGTAGTVGTALVGQYGSLTLNATGGWTYVVDNSNAAVNALAPGQTLTESFNYTVMDSSGVGGLTDTAVLSITIQGAKDSIAVNNVFVNEGSPYAVFTVSGAPGIAVTLGLSNSTGLAASDAKATLGTDLGNTLEYFNGSSWTSYSAGSPPVLPSGGQLLVRVAINNDAVYEGNESFSLTATTVSDTSTATGIGTIGDEGQGDVYVSTNTTGTASDPAVASNTVGHSYSGTLDDDRPTISITSPTVVEGNTEVFTVSLDKLSSQDISFTPTLSSGTATIGTDTAAAGSLQVSTDGGTTWTTTSGAVTIAAGQSSVQLRLATVADGGASNQSFTLRTGDINTGTVRNPTGVTGTATITPAGAPPSLSITDNNGSATGQESVAENLTLSNKSFGISAPLGLSKITVAGTDVTAAQLGSASTTPVAITTPGGVLTITGYNSGTGVITYSYDPTGTSQSNNSATVTDAITLSVTDTSAQTSSVGTLTVLITDTAPVANADAGSITKGSTSISSNVVTGTGSAAGAVADTASADASTSVVGVAAGNTGANLSSGGTVGTSVNGSYGNINIAADGSYTYTLNNANSTVQGLVGGQSVTDTFTYTIQDGDGSQSHTTITVTVNGANAAVPTVSITDNNGSAAGQESVAENAALSNKSFTISAPGGLSKITVAGTDVTAAQLGSAGTTPINITTPGGVLTITGYNSGTGVITYSYDPAGTSQVNNSATVTDAITLSATDVTNQTSSVGTLTVLITDTAPVANADAGSITKGSTSISSNVVTGTGSAAGAVGDTASADASTSVVGVAAGNTGANLSSGGTVGTSVNGSYGNINIAADGSYTYTLNNANSTVQGLVGGQSVTDTFTYTIQDGDGSQSHTTITVTVNGVNAAVPTVSITDNNGSAAGQESVAENGALSNKSFTINAPGGLSKITVAGTDVTAAQLGSAGTTPINITTPGGVLTITGYNSGTGVITYSYDPAGTSQVNNSATVTDAITLSATDVTNQTSSVGTLTVLITDTAPVANADTGSITKGSTSISSNVVTGTGSAAGAVADTASADASTSVVGVAAGNTGANLSSGGTVGSSIAGSYGSINIAADGSYTYTLNNANSTVQSLVGGQSVTDTFTYTIQDGDGSQSHTTITVTVNGANPVVAPLTVNNIDVNEGSPYAVFTVSGAPGQLAQLGFAAGTATGGGVDFGGSVQVSVDGGNTWTSYSGGNVALGSGGALLVRTPIVNDTILDNGETFTLTATNTVGTASSGLATIHDDGTGTIYKSDGTTDPTATKDDDRPVAVAPAPTVTPVAEPVAAPAPLPLPPVAVTQPVEVPAPAPAPFNSATVAQVQAPLPVPERPAVAVERQLTSDAGFTVVVADPGNVAQSARLTVLNAVTDQFAEANRATKFALPFDTFVHTKPDATITLMAKQADGSPLPEWVQFDAQSGTFTVLAPASFHSELKLMVIARDHEGREAVAPFRFFVGQDKAKPTQVGRLGLSQQLQMAAGRQPTPWSALLRQPVAKPVTDVTTEPAEDAVAAEQ